MRSHIGIRAAALVMFCASVSAFGQAYPQRTVRILVPTAPGGGTDIQARLLAKNFQEAMGQPFVIENRQGASGMIGAELAAKAPPDGYTLLMTSTYLATNVSLYRKMPFDPMKDLAPIGQVSFAPQLLIVHPSVPARSVKELVALAKKTPGRINAGSSGNGSANHLALEMLKQRAGIDVIHIPYKSGAPAMTALISGEVDFTYTGVVTALPHVRNNHVRPLAVTSLKRSSVVPDVPTMDSVYPGYESANWYAMFAPAGTPEAIVNRLSVEMAKALKTREMREFIARDGAEPVGSTPQEMAAFFRREVERYAKVIKAGNVRVE
jgi:tripartite-type tricarboxylate transporter receptor subunit TctC